MLSLARTQTHGLSKALRLGVTLARGQYAALRLAATRQTGQSETRRPKAYLARGLFVPPQFRRLPAHGLSEIVPQVGTAALGPSSIFPARRGLFQARGLSLRHQRPLGYLLGHGPLRMRSRAAWQARGAFATPQPDRSLRLGLCATKLRVVLVARGRFVIPSLAHCQGLGLSATPRRLLLRAHGPFGLGPWALTLAHGLLTRQFRISRPPLVGPGLFAQRQMAHGLDLGRLLGRPLRQEQVMTFLQTEVTRT